MTFAIHKSGGTNAGRRVIKLTHTEPWVCGCYTSETIPGPAIMLGTADVPPSVSYEDGEARTYFTRPAYLTRCPDCGTRRP